MKDEGNDCLTEMLAETTFQFYLRILALREEELDKIWKRYSIMVQGVERQLLQG
jgi:hypothetical protein